MHDLIRGMATLGHHDVDDSLRNTFAEASTFTRVIAELFPTRSTNSSQPAWHPSPAVSSRRTCHVGVDMRATQARGSAAPRCLRDPLTPYPDVGDDPRRPFGRRSCGGFDRPNRGSA